MQDCGHTANSNALGLTAILGAILADALTGKSGRYALIGLLRQSMFAPTTTKRWAFVVVTGHSGCVIGHGSPEWAGCKPAAPVSLAPCHEDTISPMKCGSDNDR